MQTTSCVHNILLCAFVLSALLHVTAQIVWLTRPRHTAVALGQDLVLNCRADAEAPSGGRLSFTWLFNQSTVQSKALLMANSSLFVPHITSGDEGEYVCVVTRVHEGEEHAVNASATVVIAYIDDFFLHPEDTTAAVGSEAVLTCVTGRSAPYPSIYWEIDGVKMENAKTLTAAFGELDSLGLSAQISMKLMYRVVDLRARSIRCVAQNPLSGETVKSQAAVVTPQAVDVEPQILTTLPAQIIARRSQRLALDCHAIGYPQPIVLWYKDRDYVDDSRVFLLPNKTLVFPEVGEEDAGTYRCEAKNSAGRVESGSMTLVVAFINGSFSEEPSDTTATAGHPVTLFCTPPYSVPPANVTWYKDYAPFTPRTGMFAATVVHEGVERNLHFSSVQESDEGEYYCVANNQYSAPVSRTSTIARLTVEGSPVITEPPINTKVLKGTLLGLKCLVDLRTVTSVFWSFRGDRIQTSSTVWITNHGQELWISNMGKAWEGRYTCTAENNFGQKTVSATVTVIVPPVALRDLGSRTVTVDYAVLLPCYIYGDPTPAFLWFHDGVLVTDDKRHRLLPTGLYIDPASVEDRGHYSCKGSNSGGTAWSNGTLDVTVPPTADIGSKEVTAIVGEPLTLRCQVQGHPAPSVSWLHNGSRRVDDGWLGGDNTTMTVPVFTWAWSGQYTCVATNVEDTAMDTVTVHTQVKPQVLKVKGQTDVDIGRTLHLTCQVEGRPSPEITWLHEGKIIQPSLNGRVGFPDPRTVLVKLVTREDGGQYSCVASSPIGNSSQSVSIVIVEPPRPPQLLEATAQSVNSVLLRWQHVFQPPNTRVTAFIIHYRKRVGMTTVSSPKLSPLVTEKEVEGLVAGTEYVFTVSAENSAGEGIHSNSLTATTFQSGPSAPRNIRVISTTATTATVYWEIPDEPNGNIERYQLQFKPHNETDYSVLSVTSSSSPSQRVVLDKLTPNTVYSVRVRGANLWKGRTLWGLMSSPLTLRTNESAPSGPPRSVQVSVLGPFSVQVDWQPVPPGQQNGPILRYKITYRLENRTPTLGSVFTDSSQQTVVIRDLSPWTRYSFTVEAENAKGVSPKSEVISIRTDPTVPGSPPQNLEVSALPGNTLHISWQPVPAKSRNCELAAYVVQYRLATSPAWKELTTLDNHTLSVSISGISAWSWYDVRVAAETRQVSPGRGPFTAVVEAHTLQAAAGPVRQVSFNISTTAISVSWAPPVELNGVLKGYRVDFHPVPFSVLEHKVLVVHTTQVRLSDLKPGLLYNISVSALNAAGRGNVTFIKLRTEPLPPPPPFFITTQEEGKETYESVKEITTMVGGNQTSSSASHQLPAIVAGSLTGAAFLLLLLIFLLWRCYRARRQTRAKYLIQNSSLQGFGSETQYRHMDEANDFIITNPQRSSSSEHSDSSASVLPSSSSSPPPLQHQQQQQQQHQQQQQQQAAKSRRPQQLADPTWLSQQAQKLDVGVEGPPVYLPVGGGVGETVPQVLVVPPSADRDVFFVQGIDNAGFSGDRLLLPGLSPNAELPSPDGASVTAGEEGAQLRSSTLNRKKGRMRSESAAAIAVMRSTPSPADDTQFLLSNEFSNVDSEVVFKHRTVL